MRSKLLSILFALLAAVFYAVNIPLSKLLLDHVSPTMMAGLLYLGAGIGVGIMFVCRLPSTPKTELLAKPDFPYVLGMIALDIAAPILLMFGVKGTTSGNATLLNNFEIVATSLIALLIFKEAIDFKLWIAILLVTLSGGLLTFDAGSLQFSWHSLLVLGAATCWGLENNCTRRLASKSAYEIVTVKGLCCGAGSLVVGFAIGEPFPLSLYLLYALLLGFVAYGLSIFFYVKAQNKLGAAKTSAFYAINPFIGVALSLILFRTRLEWNFYLSLGLMVCATALVVWDTLEDRHAHLHRHYVTHTHDGVTHTHVIEHFHPHGHLVEGHTHRHLFVKNAPIEPPDKADEESPT